MLMDTWQSTQLEGSFFLRITSTVSVMTLNQLLQRMEAQDAEREAKREEHMREMEELRKARPANREVLRQEFMATNPAAPGQISVQQV
jgi:membrane protein involved in colicin uptake